MAVWGGEGGCEGRYCCGSGEVLMELLRERTLLRQWGNTGKAPAGAGTAAAVGKYILSSCGSRHCCGSGEIYLRSCGSRHCCGSGGKQEALLLEQTLLWQWGKNTGSAHGGAVTTAVVRKYR